MVVQEKLVQLLREETTKLALVQEVDAFLEAKAQDLADLVEQARQQQQQRRRECRVWRVAERGARQPHVQPCVRLVGAEQPPYSPSHNATLLAVDLQSKEAFDELERQVNERNAKEFDAALVRPRGCCLSASTSTLTPSPRLQESINALSDDFEKELAADRADAEARLAELATFEEQAARDANSSLFFQSLYQPTVTAKPKSKGSAAEGSGSGMDDSERRAAQAEQMLEDTTPTFLSGLPPAARGGVYAAAAGTLMALCVAQAGEPQGLSPAQGATTLAVVALLASRVFLEARRAQTESREAEERQGRRDRR